MSARHRAIAIAFVFLVAGCAPHATMPLPTAQQAAHASHVSPAGGTTGLPGGGTSGLPGAVFGCSPQPPVGAASCTIAINVNYPPISNPNTPANLIPGFQPPDLQAAYQLPAQNAGGLIAIVDAFDDPTAESDLAVYRATMSLPACTSLNGCFAKLNQTGQSGNYPAPDVGWAKEVAIDLDMVSAACPTCTIALIEANSASMDDLGASVDTAASLHPVAISNSYFSPEWAGEKKEDVHYNHPGIGVTVASGDLAAPAYPAASKYVTAVSGTSLTKGSSGFTEAGWTYSGHGCSVYVAKPPFQAHVSTGCSTRSTTDVSAVADPQTGVAMFSTAAGGWVVGGGTSVGTPIIAAAYALSAHPAGPAYSYARPQYFNDIPPAGYDQLSGLGSPKGVRGF